MKTKHFFIISVFYFLFIINSNAQNSLVVVYAYDAAGNRVSRSIVMPAKISNPSITKDSTNGPVYFDSFKDAKVKIYPNPTRGLINFEVVDFQSDYSFNLIILDIAGKIVYQKENVKSVDQIDVSSLNKGNYILKISLGNEIREWKILKL